MALRPMPAMIFMENTIEMAYKILDIQKLTDLEAGTTVVLVRYKAGRYPMPYLLIYIVADVGPKTWLKWKKQKQIKKYAKKHIKMDLSRMGNRQLWQRMKQYDVVNSNFCGVAKKHGFDEMGSRRLGGVQMQPLCNGQNPVLCSCR